MPNSTVMCKDCKYWECESKKPPEESLGICKNAMMPVTMPMYGTRVCFFGERKEDADTNSNR